MTDNNKPEEKADNMSDTEQPLVDTQADVQEAIQPETSPAAPRKKKRLGPWFFLLFIFIALPAAWLLSPPEMRQQALDILKPGKAHKPMAQATQPLAAAEPQSETAAADAASVIPAVAPEPAAQPQGETDAIDTAAAQAEPVAEVAATAPETPASIRDVEPVNSDMVTLTPDGPVLPVPDNAASLQEEINRLQGELSDVQAEREQLKQELKTSKAIELRVWLSLLASPDTRLSHRIGMWGYLASLPSLDESEQGKAREMGMMLQHDRTKLAAMRKLLKQLAETIPAAQQVDIIPKPENPYLAWLIGAFHLRHAPSVAEQEHAGLRRQLLDMEHALSIEDWPEPRAWRRLLSAVRDQLSDTADADLSESMDDIRVDIDVSRKAAADWMEVL
ncbi:MAG: hypothetical protein COW19_06170 [Zetaproteobacteria bacterium CG12_big_fil_rev_8_21_14_0_65_55_1124]|nr:MAG: hypothetical protein AUJ58_06045 [Zetaproteobacteria bacterium CG1_02_55_237]PIS19820.1 MAG: hypothetical protein COT53_03850 [Zetaproteobacteria bacterium CG08_land_8_20_14_0_20_55_17]PIW42850.1 MAG: hypothetical protein COW19_06170 [Zetaproteobacteria bacterium CG12_big_fil_rev_8_21_14_0_65_55_1124]PIY51667.1 MAG: hypothetical protein COZ01_10540 [Zetaproteobacteria bacterium CG_4_10_14_0_8_um_filter_55_43]PIZ39840.1 MAG: hypothetical protein COY36_01940 [Zetaproteobacteria bacterium 